MHQTCFRPLRSLLLGIVLAVGIASPTLAWGNGPNEGNGYGTHDWIISQALKVFGDEPPAWLDVTIALKASDDPDRVFKATGEHVYKEKGSGRGAVDRIAEFYHDALIAHADGDDEAASVYVGWVAHFYGDILQPYHTKYRSPNPHRSHHRYEPLVNALTRSSDASPDWMTPNREPKAIDDIRVTAIEAAAFSRPYFAELFREFHADESYLNERVMEITGLMLQRASSDLADILFSIDQGVGDAPPAATLTTRVKTRYIKPKSTQSIYVTVKDAEGRPLEGVRVDIRFPKPTGGTTLLRRYTMPDGIATGSANVGRGAVSEQRDVTVTVETGAVMLTDATWFMATRPLASGKPGFKSIAVDPTVQAEQTAVVRTRARDRRGRPVANLKVTWAWTFSDGSRTSTVGYTDALGRAYWTMPITSGTPHGVVKVSAKTQSGGVTRTSSTSLLRY